MAAIVRIKRRRDEDPQDLLLLSCKKLRQITSSQEKDVSDQRTVFKFAGTVSSKDAAVSKPVRDAIRKEKVEREFKQHQLNTFGGIREQTRSDHRQSSKKSRYRVISSHRALNLDSLDEIDESVGEQTAELPFGSENNETACERCGRTIKSRKEKNIVCRCNTMSEEKVSETSGTKINTVEANKITGSDNTGTKNSLKTDELEKNKEVSSVTGCVGASNKDNNDRKMFCLLDVENEMPSYQSLLNQSTSDQITCNSEPMAKEIVSERESDDNYVYDLYYVNNQDFDFRMLERDLTLESFWEDRLYTGGMSDDEEFIYDDEDDENDENNWRNDYPDEDPGFIENYDDVDEDFYGRGLHEIHAFESGQDHQLAEWMSWRCNIEDTNELSSDEDEVEKYETGPKYSSDYYRYVRELNRKQQANDESD